MARRRRPRLPRCPELGKWIRTQRKKLGLSRCELVTLMDLQVLKDFFTESGIIDTQPIDDISGSIRNHEVDWREIKAITDAFFKGEEIPGIAEDEPSPNQ